MRQPLHILSKAITFATTMHDGQFDRGGHPYILHPLKVMYKLKTDDEELMAIAVLHDVVEDCFKGRHDEGYAALEFIGMTPRVVTAVRLLTKRPDQTYEDYIEGICTSRDAILVKKSDVRQNKDLRRLKGITEKDLARDAKYTRTYWRLDAALSEMDYQLVLAS